MTTNRNLYTHRRWGGVFELEERNDRFYIKRVLIYPKLWFFMCQIGWEDYVFSYENGQDGFDPKEDMNHFVRVNPSLHQPIVLEPKDIW